MFIVTLKPENGNGSVDVSLTENKEAYDTLRKCVPFIFIISFIMLVACEEGDTSTENNTQNVSDEKTNNGVEEKSEDKPEESEDEDEENEIAATESSPSGVKEVFEKAAEVMQDVVGMTLTGDMRTTTDMMGMEESETSQLTGEISMKPFAQHYNIHSESDLDGITEMEMYMTQDAMYVFESDSGSWLSISMEQAGAMGDVAAIMTESQFHYLAGIHDLFELSDENDHYKLTYTGSGSEFKKVAYGAMKEIAGEDVYESFTNMITDASGTYEITIDKETFYIIDLKMDIEQTMNMGLGEVNSTEQLHYIYNDFNNVAAVIVPDDVKENAQSFDIPGSINNED